MREKRRNTLKVIGALLIFFAVLIIVLILILFNGRETITDEDEENKVVTGLDCKAGSIEGAFFTSGTVITVKNQIKLTFGNDKIDKIYYSYVGTYRSREEADHDNAVLHARFNEHMAKFKANPDLLTPSFSTVKTELRINLYAKNREMIDRSKETIFFIEEGKVDEFMGYSRDKVMDYYKKRGFSCEKQN